MNYYNEFDPGAAQWLRNLIAEKLIPAGVVDERSIIEVKPDDLAGFTQCHFFAGIGGWSYALQLADWPATRLVWTGSCPCQPYSVAGKQLGDADERNLWPAFFNLIRECRPVRVFGEQVAGAIGHGWLDGVRADLEVENYACGAVVLGAHSVGAPHIRQRLYWVANDNGVSNTNDARLEGAAGARVQGRVDGLAGGGDNGWMANGIGKGLERFAGHVANGNEPGRLDAEAARPVAESGSDRGLSNAGSERCDRESIRIQPRRQDQACFEVAGRGAWGGAIWIPCADGKARRIEPGLSPLAHGVPARVVRLRGYGNAIVPQVAAEFIKATM